MDAGTPKVWDNIGRGVNPGKPNVYIMGTPKVWHILQLGFVPPPSGFNNGAAVPQGLTPLPVIWHPFGISIALSPL